MLEQFKFHPPVLLSPPFRGVVGCRIPASVPSELEAGGWLTTKASPDEIFADPDDLWSSVSGRIGREILTSSLNPKHFPADPTLN